MAFFLLPVACKMGTEMDMLAVGDYVLFKEQQDESLKENYEERYESYHREEDKIPFDLDYFNKII